MIKFLYANDVGCLSTNLVGLGILMRVIAIYFEEKTLTSNYVQKLHSYMWPLPKVLGLEGKT